jgi:hypothetical protein
VNDAVEGSGRGLILRYYSGMHLEGLRKTMKAVSQDSRCLGQDLNKKPAEYSSGMLTAPV